MKERGLVVLVSLISLPGKAANMEHLAPTLVCIRISLSRGGAGSARTPSGHMEFL